MDEGKSTFKILTGKPTGKRLLGRHRRRWEDKIRINLNKIVSIREIALVLLMISIIGDSL